MKNVSKAQRDLKSLSVAALMGLPIVSLCFPMIFLGCFRPSRHASFGKGKQARGPSTHRDLTAGRDSL